MTLALTAARAPVDHLRRRRPFLVVLLMTAACAPARAGVPTAPTPAPSQPSPYEEGIASWYGPGFDGRLTASGEPFDADALTAAHPSLPFDTRIRVEHMASGRTVVVRINDRGPAIRGRIIDVSQGAAERLGMIEEGTARVRLYIVNGLTAR